MSEQTQTKIFIDGDFSTGKECKYHCAPTCHPFNIGPEPFFACKHPSWPENIYGDFAPGVSCNGEWDKCEIGETIKKIELQSDKILGETLMQILSMASKRNLVGRTNFKNTLNQITNRIYKKQKEQKG